MTVEDCSIIGLQQLKSHVVDVLISTGNNIFPGCFPCVRPVTYVYI